MKKTLFLFIFIAVLSACKNDKKQSATEKPSAFKAETKTLDSTSLEACQTMRCPSIQVSYLKIEGNNKFSRSINTKNQKDLTALFELEPDSSATKTKTVEEAVNDFAEDYLKFKSNYPESSEEYEANVSQEIKSQNQNTVVLKTTFYLFTGGAHGYGGVHFLNFDAHSGKYLTHDDLIADKPAFTDFMEKKFRQQYQIPPEADINSKGFFFEDGKFALPKNIAVTDKEVILLYNPYEAASYAEGQLRFVFPKKQVEQWLRY